MFERQCFHHRDLPFSTVGHLSLIFVVGRWSLESAGELRAGHPIGLVHLA